MNQAVYMNDLQQFAGVLDQASSRTAEDVTTRVIHAMGDEVARLAYQYAPKDTYELARSIHAIKGPRYAQVVADAPHAAYVEFGTWSKNVIAPKSGTYTIRPRKAGGVLRFTNAQGETVFTRKVEHPGIDAQMYMARANQEALSNFVGTLANVGVTLVTG